MLHSTGDRAGFGANAPIHVTAQCAANCPTRILCDQQPIKNLIRLVRIRIGRRAFKPNGDAERMD
jgi:hypothetical protein